MKVLIDQTFPPESKFSPEQIPDLTGRVIIVTGGNTGLGKETIKQLLKKNAKVYMAARSQSRAEAAIAALKEDTGKEAIWLPLDLSDLKSVKNAAETFMSQEKELHILFNNAGVMLCPIEDLTNEGYDMQFGTNVIGHWYFTELLMPALLAGKETSPDGHARIITTASNGAYFYTLNWDTFKDGPQRRKMSKINLYSQSKFANVVIAREIYRRYADKGILSMSVNPGILQTDLQRHIPWYQKMIIKTILHPAHYGALTQLWGGTMPETIQYNGEFLIPWARLGRCREEAYDPEIGDRLWKWLEGEIVEFEKSQPHPAA
ncbi:NAD(P)-binding protein [Abortiporus biennis]|nr:NAD(P)-binding protein [Abortiporus biennis]